MGNHEACCQPSGCLLDATRWCCHLLLDHLHRNDRINSVLLCRSRNCAFPLEDILACGWAGDFGRRCALHYMREYWVQVHLSPIVYRYVDWSITVPLQMIEFNLILKAAGKQTSAAMFWKLLLGTVIMLAFGYCGEITVLNAWPAFAGGLAGWGFILFEIFAGEAGGTASGCSEAVVSSFNNMRMIVTAGWSIYPLGYLFGYLLGAVDETFLNVIYNIADFVNKIAFVLACWSAAKADSAGKRDALLA